MINNLTSKKLSMKHHPIRIRSFSSFAPKYVYDHQKIASYTYFTSSMTNTTYSTINIINSHNHYAVSKISLASSYATMTTSDNNYYVMRYYSTDLGRWTVPANIAHTLLSDY